jgi:hypothetical protein
MPSPLLLSCKCINTILLLLHTFLKILITFPPDSSCPSGQKSMPVISDTDDYGGYRIVIEKTFKRMLEKADKAMGGLAVICDKNMMEASGYAAVIADVMHEQVSFY